jgi:hypothetical protein
MEFMNLRRVYDFYDDRIVSALRGNEIRRADSPPASPKAGISPPQLHHCIYPKSILPRETTIFADFRILG